MKELKANKIEIFSSIDELKMSRINEPFDPIKHTNYIKKLQEFHKYLKEIKKD